MSDYAETLRRHARLSILRLLEDAPRYTSNTSMMTQLLQSFGITFARDQVDGEVAWLEEQGLVSVERAAGIVIVTATGRGIEIAQGVARHPGVQRPSPRA